MSGNALTNADSEPGAFARVVSGRKSKWVVFGVWLLVIFSLFSFATKLNDAQKNDSTSWLPKSAESTKELKIEGDFHPNWVPAILLFARSTGLTDADKARAEHAAAVMQQDPPAKNLDLVVHNAVQVIPATTGPSAGKAIQIIVPVNPGSAGWNKFPDTVKAMKDALGPPTAGLQTYVTGPMGEAGDEADAFKKINGSLTYFTALAVIIILLIAYRSPILWLLPLLTVGGGALTVAESVIYLLAKHAGLTVNGQAAFILIVLVFGAGTDYALLLIARYREELRRYEDRHEAMAHAVHRAGPALVASSATVAVSMLILLVAEMNSTKGMGPVLAIGVIIALCAMLTLMPALLVIFGRWVFWPVRPTVGSEEPTATGVWARMGKRIAIRPRAVWVATAVVLVALAGGVTELNAHQQTVAEQFVTKPASVTGSEVQAQYFPSNSGQPLAVIGDAGQQDAVAAKLKTVAGIDPGSVGTPKTIKSPVVNGRFYLEAAPPTRRTPRPRADRGPGPRGGALGARSRRPGRRRAGGEPGHRPGLQPRQQADHPADPAGGVHHPGSAAARLHGTAAADPDGDPVLRRLAGDQRPDLQQELRLARRGHRDAVVRLRVPGGAGHRLQHLPDDPHPGGVGPARHPPRRAGRPVRHRRRDHLGRAGAGRPPSACWPRCRSCPSPRSASRSPSACCWTP